MKKKLIEKVKFKFTNLKTTKKHIHMVDAQLKDKYILFDFYTNVENKWKPDFRCAIGPKEFENYVVETGIWNKQRINYLIGEERYFTNYTEYRNIVKRIEVADEVRRTAEEYFTLNDLHTAYYSSDLISQIEQVETHIHWEYQAAAEERRYKRVQDKMAELEPLPRDFRKFLTEKAYKNDHILFYSDEKAFCSRCGSYLPAGTYKHNQKCSCPECRKKVTAKSYKRMIAPKEIRKEILVIQEHGEEIVCRYVKACLIQDGEEKEKLEWTESVRTYHGNDIGNYRARYIHYFDNMARKDFWDNKMNPYRQVGYGRSSILYTNNWDELKGIVNIQWLDLMKYWSDEGIGMPLKDILQRSRRTLDVIERLFKAGLKRLATELAKQNVFGLDYDAKELKNILGLTKPLFNWAQKNDINGKQLAILSDACKNRYGLNDNEILELVKADIGATELKVVSKGNKLMKTLHYLEKAKGYKTVREKYSHYSDYLGLAKQLNYDLDNDTVRYPKDLKAAHDKTTSEFNVKEFDEKIRKAILKYPNITYSKDELDKDFGFKDKSYEIVAPMNAGDIIEEGRTLHHCVGGDNYLNKHNTGKTFILFMRKTEAPDERYYTIEIDPIDLRIIQYYGAYDKKPDKEQVDKFLEKWKKYLKRTQTKEAV